MNFYKSKNQKIFLELLKFNLISKEMKILNFEDFFDNLDLKLNQITGNLILNKFNSAKGISFELVLNSIINNNAIKFDSENGKNANVIKLFQVNFNHTWQFGFTKKQNFSFTIYFNKEDIISKNGIKAEINENYSKEHLRILAAASPQIAEKALMEQVLRITGYLNSKNIKAIGFRYKNNENKFEIKFYQLH